MRIQPFIALFAVSCIWPVGSRAHELVIPELGVRIPTDSDLTDKLHLIRRVDGYEATIALGLTRIDISRLDEPAPAASRVKDKAYLSQLQQEFRDQVGSNAHQGQSVVGQHEAWTIAEAAPLTDFLGARIGAQYSIITYVIVDQHLYRILTRARTNGPRPPEFDKAIAMISDLAFEPISAESVARSLTPTGLLLMPAEMKLPYVRYPPYSQGRGDEGIVDVEYGIDANGKTGALRILQSSGEPQLDSAARDLVRHVRYQVPSNWAATGYQGIPFDLEVHFALSTARRPCDWDPLPRLPPAAVVTICARRTWR